MLKGVVAIVGVVLVAGAGFAIGLHYSQSQPPTHTLLTTAAERPALTEFGTSTLGVEELLAEEFPHGGGCAVLQAGVINFPLDNHGCTPLASYHPYFDLFTGLGKSPYHVTTTKYDGQRFGVYPAPILIGGDLIACNPKDSQYLVAFGDAVNLSLGCAAPLG